jgi:hypothetical protein
MTLVLLGLVGMIVVLLLLLITAGESGSGPVTTPSPTPDSLGAGVLFLEISNPSEAEVVVSVATGEQLDEVLAVIYAPE